MLPNRQSPQNNMKPVPNSPWDNLASFNTPQKGGQGQIPNNKPNQSLPQQINNMPNQQSNQQQRSPLIKIQHDPDIEAPRSMPYSSDQIIEYMKKRPYTQLLFGSQFTYSILAKKQQTFVLTHERFLMLKGFQSISYARIFPAGKILPFKSPSQVLTPKTTFSLSEITKVQNNKDGHLIIHFLSGTKKITWEFHCPTSSCAVEWTNKIEEGIRVMSQFRKSGFKTIGEFLQFRQNMAMNRVISNQQVVNHLLGQDNNGQIINANVANQNPQNNISPNNPNNPNNLENRNSPHNLSPNSNFPLPNLSPSNKNNNNFNPNNSLPPNNRISPPNRNLSPNLPPPRNFPLPSFSPKKLSQSSPPQNLSPTGNLFANGASLNRYPLGVNVANFSLASSFNQNMQPSQNRSIGTHFHKLSMPNSIQTVQDFIAYPNYDPTIQKQPLLGRSMSKIRSNQKNSFISDLNRFKRNWIQELVGGQEEGQLIIDFKNYIQIIASVIIDQLYVPQHQKIFPAVELTNDHASYVLDDAYIQIYFLTQQNVDRKHQRYQQAALQFKNMDYILSTTRNQGVLKVPFYTIFQYKGFQGMAKSKIGDAIDFANRQCYNNLNIKQFEETSHISANTLLNQNTCKIVSFQRRTSLSMTTSNRPIYFVERITELLPLERGQLTNDPTKVLRPELLQDNLFDGVVLRDQRRPLRPQMIAKVLDAKENQILNTLQNQQEYFTNSKQLADLLHYSGLNMRHLGSLFQKSRLVWLKRIFQAEILARSLKNYFRFYLQSSVRLQNDRNNMKQNQQLFEKKRVIIFLNDLFGVSQSTNNLWKRINSYSRQHFGTYTIQNNYTEINISYFLQAIQNHLKIFLSDQIHSRTFFQSHQSLDDSDLIRFQFGSTIYNLNFTNTFVQINECLQERSPQSFANLCQVLIKQTSNQQPYLQMIKKHSIHDKISNFLLDFTSPQENRELYLRLESNPLPTKFLYESKLAEIKWYMKYGKIDLIKQPMAVLLSDINKWFGQTHPLYVQVYRLLAQFFCNHQNYHVNAIQYANQALEIHMKIYGAQKTIMWKDYLLIGKAYFASKNLSQSINYLVRAKEIVRIQQLNQYESYSELNLLLCRILFIQQNYQQTYRFLQQLYLLLKKQIDEPSLYYLLQTVKWLKQIFEHTNQHQTYYQFLQTDFSNIISSYIHYPALLQEAVKITTIAPLKNAILRRSSNKALLMNLVEQVAKIDLSTNMTLGNYISTKITDRIFPKNFLHQLKDVDGVVEEIVQNKLFDRWRAFYQTANQTTLDTLATSSINRGLQFLVNITSLYDIFGKQVLSEIHTLQG